MLFVQYPVVLPSMFMPKNDCKQWVSYGLSKIGRRTYCCESQGHIYRNQKSDNYVSSFVENFHLIDCEAFDFIDVDNALIQGVGEVPKINYVGL